MQKETKTRTITISILFFASLKDYFKSESREMEIPENLTIKEVKEKLFQNAQQKIKEKPLMYAVNHHYASLDFILKDGDELAFLPLVSGG